MKGQHSIVQLAVEALEPRRLLSGSVLAVLAKGVLEIRGDRQDNAISVYRDGTGNIYVSGGQFGTKVNGRASARFAESRVTAIDCRLGDGNDFAQFGIDNNGQFTGLTLPGSFSIFDDSGDNGFTPTAITAASFVAATGPGSDGISPEFCTFDSMTIDTGAGSDSVPVYSNTIGTASIVTGDDGDVVGLGGNVINSLSISTGAGNDSVGTHSFPSGDVFGSLRIDTGTGNDFLSLDSTTITSSMSVTLGDGSDFCQAQNTTGPGNGILDGGADSDTYHDNGGNSGFSTVNFETT